MPDQEQVRCIFRDTYSFYLKYKDISNPDQWAPLMQEMHQMDKKYSCELCRQILLELVKVIESEFLKKQGGNAV
jgi:hypothetical protein